MNHSSSVHGSDPLNYETWTREELIARLKELAHPTPTPTPTPTPAPLPISSTTGGSRRKSKSSSPSSPSTKKKGRPKREFNFSAYATQKIALKFTYAGAGYGGLAWQAGPTPLPTVEGVLFAALSKARLVDPEGGLEGCGWERCGRTDRGVSAAGQVVSLYNPSPSAEARERSSIRYLHTLNGILPPSIRVYAWAPVAPTFSARFSCRTRHYKYFFSARNLDVDAMRSGAARLVGEHDFRNLCKLDPAKQLTSFRRRILRADISPIDTPTTTNKDNNNNDDMKDTMHVLDLVGTAFLYNQVRHIMAVLLLIGARLESPNVISALLNTGPPEGGDSANGKELPLPVVRCKPEYQMADALPLMLWDCTYDDKDVPWRTDDAGLDGGSVGLHTQLVGLAERARVEATLAEHFLTAASQFHPPAPTQRSLMGGGPLDVPLGGGRVRREGNYVELLKRKRMESVEEINARWRRRKKGVVGD
ncbi:pseudouridine synthase [Lactifluus volemus]|nr:pseudouridine synthase [Lactifluus volemus]